MIDRDMLWAAGGAAMEAAGSLLRNEHLADRGRLTQFRHLRRRQMRVARSRLRLPLAQRVRTRLGHPPGT